MFLVFCVLRCVIRVVAVSVAVVLLGDLGFAGALVAVAVCWRIVGNV